MLLLLDLKLNVRLLIFFKPPDFLCFRLLDPDEEPDPEAELGDREVGDDDRTEEESPF